jgi:four helix bundle protein
MFGIIDQSRRASVSIPTNIAEGFGRNSRKEFLRFLRYAMGSLFEIQTHLRISLELNYISQHQYNCFYNDSREIERMLSALINKLVYLETHNMKKPD